MKILRIIARLNVGGPSRHVVWLSRELADGEFQSTLIAGRVPAGEEDMGYLAAENGISPIYIEHMSRELSFKDIVSLYKVFQEIRRFRPDIVHTHTAKAGTVGRSAAFLYKWLTWKSLLGRPNPVRVVHTFHGHVFHSYYGKVKTSVFLTIERLLARFATDKIVVISEQQFNEIHSDFKVGTCEKFATVPLGIDLEPFSNSAEMREKFRSEVNAESGEVLVGFVGRLTEIKNLPLLFDAAAVVKEHNAPGVPKMRFVIIGDGHLRSSLEAEAAGRGLEDIVQFLGNRSDTETVYAGLDIVALTSLNEGTPLSLIEAMAARRAVISTRVGGVRDLLGAVEEDMDGFSIYARGVGIETFSAEDLAKGLIYLAKDERLRKSLSSRGRAFVESQYSKDRLVSDIKDLYRHLAAPRERT